MKSNTIPSVRLLGSGYELHRKIVVMSKIVMSLLVLFPFLSRAQTTSQNYVKSTSYKQPSSSVTIDPNNPSHVSIQVSYFDGLGRPIQQIANKQSASGKNIVTHIEYDALGRQIKEYLPFKSGVNDLSFIAGNTAKTELLDYYASGSASTTGNPYFDATSYPYSEKQLEASPLNRVLKQAAPGDPWAINPTGADHTIKFDYQTNVNTDAVKWFKATTLWSASEGLYIPTLVDNTTYGQYQLFKSITKDENWTSGDNNTTHEFKDKEGRVILKRTFGVSMVGGVATNTSHDTYYVYDEYGNLTYVIPPLANASNITATVLNGLCYQYKYDHRNRLVEKKLPGKQWEFIVYDKLDQVVFTGPALSPFNGIDDGWLFTKYDAFGRVCYTAWQRATITSSLRSSLQSTYNTAAISNATRTNATIDNITINHSANNNPSGLKLLTVNYYDNYSYPNAPTLPTTIEGVDVLTKVKGLTTGNWTRVMLTTGVTDAETSHTLYNTKSQPIRTYKQNFKGGYTRTDSKLDFLGKPIYTYTYHKQIPASLEIVTTDEFTYTAQDRLLTHTQTINNGTPQLLAHNQYDELGQLIIKNVGGEDTTTFVGFQKIDYRYNIRGWLTQINDPFNLDHLYDNDLFNFKITYNQVVDNLNNQIKPLFNGNIAETYWSTSTDNITRKYSYVYDDLNRLSKAMYQKPNNTVPVTHAYDEELSYDKNGNITQLLRNGDSDSDDINYILEIDNLTYQYDTNSPNQLKSVGDSSSSTMGFKDASGINFNGDYDYDANGNMIRDDNKNIVGILYNHLNLPTQIDFGSGDKIYYFYNAIGQKVRKKVVTVGTNASTTITDYLDGYQYTNDILNFFPHAEGYVNAITCTQCPQGAEYNFNFVFNYTDHLGNIRLSYAEDPDTRLVKVLEQTHYYPFGLKHTNYNSDVKEFKEEEETGLKIEGVPAGIVVPYKYKYNGKEYQDELGLNMYDYGARNYDPAIGRWTNMDALSDKYVDKSPYNYVFNNPVNNIDPDGNFVITAAFAKKYPNITRYVKNYLKNDIINNPKILNAIIENSRQNYDSNNAPSFTIEILQTALANGTGPGMSYRDDRPANADYDTKDQTLYFDESKLDAIEKSLSSANISDNEKRKSLIAFFSLTIHELAHYGDMIDGVTSGESGEKIDWELWFKDENGDQYVRDPNRFNPVTQTAIIRKKKDILPTLPVENRTVPKMPAEKKKQPFPKDPPRTKEGPGLRKS